MAGESRSEAETGTESGSPSIAIAAGPVSEAASETAIETAGEAASPPERLGSALETTGSAEGGATATAAGVEEEAAPAPRPAPLPGSDTLAIQLARESWVEIYDSGGGRLYFNLAGEGSEVFVRRRDVLTGHRLCSLSRAASLDRLVNPRAIGIGECCRAQAIEATSIFRIKCLPHEHDR